MRSAHSIKLLGIAAGAILTAVTATGQGRGAPPSAIPNLPAGFAAMKADDLQGGTVYGDPTKAGIYVVRNLFRACSGSRPHYHDQDRYVTVIKGTWYVHLGPESDTYDPTKMTAMPAGSFVVHPANGHHYDGAKEEDALVQIMGMGPVRTVQLEQPAGPTVNTCGQPVAARGARGGAATTTPPPPPGRE